MVKTKAPEELKVPHVSPTLTPISEFCIDVAGYTRVEQDFTPDKVVVLGDYRYWVAGASLFIKGTSTDIQVSLKEVMNQKDTSINEFLDALR